MQCLINHEHSPEWLYLKVPVHCKFHCSGLKSFLKLFCFEEHSVSVDRMEWNDEWFCKHPWPWAQTHGLPRWRARSSLELGLRKCRVWAKTILVISYLQNNLELLILNSNLKPCLLGSFLHIFMRFTRFISLIFTPLKSELMVCTIPLIFPFSFLLFIALLGTPLCSTP